MTGRSRPSGRARDRLSACVTIVATLATVVALVRYGLPGATVVSLAGVALIYLCDVVCPGDVRHGTRRVLRRSRPLGASERRLPDDGSQAL